MLVYSNMDSSSPSTSSVYAAVYCCNPLRKPDHNYFKKNLRPVSKNLLLQNKSLKPDDKICDSCRKAFIKCLSLAPEHCSSASDSSDSNEYAQGIPGENIEILTPEKNEAIEAFNRSLQSLDETPIKKKRLNEKKLS